MAKVKTQLPSAEKDTMATAQSEANVGHITRSVDVKMNRSQALLFRSLQRKLEDQDATLKDGRAVNNKRRVILWLIEKYAG